MALLSGLLAGSLLYMIFFGMGVVLVSAQTSNATASAIGASDTTGDLLADVQSDDASGASPSAVSSGDGWYTIDKTYVMFIDNFDTSSLSGTVGAATLKVQYSVESGYSGTNPINWALHGGSLASTGIVPADGQADQTGSYNLYAQGVDTLAEISTLDIEFTNNDGATPSAVSFDYVWVEVTINQAPSVPTLSSPDNSSTTSDNTPTFQWQASTDPDGDTITYWIQVDDDSGFGSPAENVTGLSTASYTPTTELSDGTYYWHVRAVDNNNNQSDWSSARSVTVSIAAAFDFSVSASPDNLTVQQTSSVSTTVTVSLVSAPAQTVSLTYSWVGTTPGGITPEFSPSSSTPGFASTLTFTAAADATVGTYTCRITGTGGTQTHYDDVTLNITELLVPAAPTLESPENGVTIDNLTPTFDWSDVTGATSYKLEVATDNNFSPAARTKTVVESTATLSEDEELSYGAQYYWRARGINAAGSGDWSSTWIFTAKVTAPKITSLDIAAGASYTNSAGVQLNIAAQNAVEMSFSDDGVVWSEWESYQTSKSYTISSGDGVKNVYVRVRDNIGDIGQTSVGSITLDQTPPTTTKDWSGDLVADGFKNYVEITFGATDATSGASSTMYRVDGGEWKSGNRFVISSAGRHTVDYYSIDAAGNTEGTKSFEVKVVSTEFALPGYWWAILLIVVVAAAVPGFFVRKHLIEKGLVRKLEEIRRGIQQIPSLKKEAARRYYTDGTLTRETYNELIKKYDTRLEELKREERELQPRVKKIKKKGQRGVAKRART